jgi:hypothetical protein
MFIVEEQGQNNYLIITFAIRSLRQDELFKMILMINLETKKTLTFCNK